MSREQSLALQYNSSGTALLADGTGERGLLRSTPAKITIDHVTMHDHGIYRSAEVPSEML